MPDAERVPVYPLENISLTVAGVLGTGIPPAPGPDPADGGAGASVRVAGARNLLLHPPER